MSAFGTKRTLCVLLRMSAFRGEADTNIVTLEVR